MPRLRVVQLNIGSLLEPGWAERRHEIVAWLSELEPDVVCMQEAWEDAKTENTAGWVVDQLDGEWHWRFGGGAFDSSLWKDTTLRFGSVIASRWPIDSVTYHRLPLADGATGFVARVPWELLHVTTAGLDVFSTHLAPAPTDALHRASPVLTIEEIVRRVRGTKDEIPGLGQRRDHMPAILCGDFNAEPDSDEIRFLTGLTALDGRVTFWQDAWRVAGDGASGLTQDWVTHPLAAMLNVHRKRIDYVLVGDPFLRTANAGRVLTAKVVFDEPRTGTLASDHKGLCVDIEWPTRPF